MQLDTQTKQKLQSFVRGEITWAEVEGMTWEEAKAIAQVGCDLAAAGRLEEARIIFEGLVAGNPNDSGSQAALGTVYQKLGRLEDALKAYDVAVELEPRNPVALANRGEIRLKAGDKQGFADLARAVDADPNGETQASRRARGIIQAITMQAVDYIKQQQQQK